MNRPVFLSVIMVAVLLLSACDCGRANPAIVDSGGDTGNSIRDGGPLDGPVLDGASSDAAPDGSPDACGTLPCCSPTELPSLSDVGRLLFDPRVVVFEPPIDGNVSESAIWQGSTETSGITDLSFLMPSGDTQHIRLPVVEPPALAVGTTVHLAIQNTPFDGLPASQVRVVVSLSDIDSGVIYAAYQTEQPATDGFYFRDPMHMGDFEVARLVSCQGPEQELCNYQTELFDMRFSSGDQSVVLGQGESGTLTLPGGRYRVMNHQSMDNNGEATGKGTCAVLLSGIRSFDIVRLP